jgi:putative membrane protein
MGDGWGWWMGFGSIWMIGFWAVIIWAVFTLRTRWIGEQDRPSQDAGTALEILERRYARGELNDEQYEAMRARLNRPTEPITA